MRKEGNYVRFGPEMLLCCGYIVTAESFPDPAEEIVFPKTGDVTVCLNCGTVLIHTDDAGSMRLLSAEELAELEPEIVHSLRRMVRLIKKRGPLPRMSGERN